MTPIESAIDAARLGSEALKKWRRAHWRERLDLSGADLTGVQLPEAELSGANLRGTILRSASLHNAHLVETDLTGAVLVQADLTEVQATQAKLRGANLRHAKLWKSVFNSADLSDGQLESADLTCADLRGADLRRADLTGACLVLANLFEAAVRDAIFASAVFGETILAGVDLSSCIGLASAYHLGPSIVGVDTLIRSRGKAPKDFLRGCGIPDQSIDKLTAVTRDADSYYTCFISYTDTDGAFRARLYDDLQAAGIACWDWRKQGKWGEPLIGQIDNAIRQYDKVVVILSDASLRAPGVLDEIDRALQREHREGSRVLFPIALDDAVFSWNDPRQSNLIRLIIGDFRNWQDPKSYRPALDRLVDALRAEDSTPPGP